jgi:PAS domain S-box-containing protein
MTMNKTKSVLVSEAIEGQLGSESSFRLLVQSVKDYAIIMLDPEGHVASWNEGAQNFKGYRAEEVIGKPFSIFYTKEDIAAGKPELELKIAADQGRFEDEGWRVRKDGSRFWANVIITALREADGTLRGFGKVTRDLTDRKQMEEALKQTAANEAIARRAQEILDISTPIVQIWEGVVLAPLIGSLDSQRTQQLMEKLLQAIVDMRSSVAIVDITGVPAVDTATGRHLVETMSAVRLIGAEVILTGVRPAIAQTLVHLGVDLAGVTTRSSLSAGLRTAMEMLNLHVMSDK